jgi:hypothetical protein
MRSDLSRWPWLETFMRRIGARSGGLRRRKAEGLAARTNGIFAPRLAA